MTSHILMKWHFLALLEYLHSVVFSCYETNMYPLQLSGVHSKQFQHAYRITSGMNNQHTYRCGFFFFLTECDHKKFSIILNASLL